MYIRTKNGVYEVIQANDIYTEVKGNTNGVPLNNGNTAIHFKEILNQSENLEELCDEFVLFYMETKNLLSIPWATYEQRGVWKKEKEHIINEITNHPPYRKPILYGAIWTSKGLIYVAKMNDKGKLVLI